MTRRWRSEWERKIPTPVAIDWYTCAYHEASHAVARLAYAGRSHTPAFDSIHLQRDQIGVRGELRGELPPAMTARQAAVALLAGAIGESLFSGQPVAELYRTSARRDLKLACDAILDSDLANTTPHAVLLDCLKEARDLVTSRWRRIERVAYELNRWGGELAYDHARAASQDTLPR